MNTQEYGRRPYGVGLLVIGQDKQGPHLYEFSPSGNSYEYYAMSIGARSQSAKTYLEKHYESFADCASPSISRAFRTSLNLRHAQAHWRSSSSTAYTHFVKPSSRTRSSRSTTPPSVSLGPVARMRRTSPRRATSAYSKAMSSRSTWTP